LKETLSIIINVQHTYTRKYIQLYEPNSPIEIC
jgi:hypothetical protein